MSEALAALTELERQRWYRGQLVRVEPLPTRAPEYAEPDPALPGPLRRYLAAARIERLYSHQVELLAAARRGEDVIITTGTASGKTIGFNLPIAESLLADPAATALYLYPLKAVTQDQLRVLRELEQAAGLSLRPAVYDGDTPRDRRAAIRRQSRVILSNPYELHQILPYQHQWQKFFARLRWVVIDEAHQYRGVFGSNVAQLIRRLRRLLALHGAAPQFVLASASIANPQELGRKLTGRDCTLVAGDGAPRGRSWLAFFNPLCDPETPATIQLGRLLAHLGRHRLQTLCFVVARRTAELVGRWLREQHPELPVASYRAGYLAEDRRRIESDLAAGRLGAVIATSALELGIDVGGLDAITIFGWPRSLASFWQQAGRAGRQLQDALIVFVGFADALDQYLLRHPEAILRRGFESAAVDLTNPNIVKGHLLCAASESPLRASELGPGHSALVAELEAELLLRRIPPPSPDAGAAAWIYSGLDRPQERVQLEAIEEHSVDIISRGRVLETIDRSRARREAHPGAVLLHMGETYLVKSLDLAAGRAEAEPAEVDYYTSVLQREELHLVATAERRQLRPGLTLSFGRLRVTASYPGYQVKKGGRVVSTHALDLPPTEFPTVGLWLEIGPEVRAELVAHGHAFAGGLHGVEHGLISLAPLLAMCDPMDIGGLSYPLFPETGTTAIFIYDGYEDGIGISEKLHERFAELARTTMELVRDCGCDNGCPACILSPRCGDANQPMDKAATLALLRIIVGD